MQEMVLNMDNLTVKESPVEDLLLESSPIDSHSVNKKMCKGVILGMLCSIYLGSFYVDFLSLKVLEPKVLCLCHQYRARPA
jgi:hypothetical protein